MTINEMIPQKTRIQSNESIIPSKCSNNTRRRAFADLEKYLSGYLNSDDDTGSDNVERKTEGRLDVVNNKQQMIEDKGCLVLESNYNRLVDSEISEEFESPSRQKQSELMIIERQTQVPLYHESNTDDNHDEEKQKERKRFSLGRGTCNLRMSRGVDLKQRHLASRDNHDKRVSKPSLHESSLKCDKNHSLAFGWDHSSHPERPSLSQTQRLAAATKTSSVFLQKQKQRKMMMKKTMTTTSTMTKDTSWSKWNVEQNAEGGGLGLDAKETSFFGPTFLNKKKRSLVVLDGNVSCFFGSKGNDGTILQQHYDGNYVLHPLETNKCKKRRVLEDDDCDDNDADGLELNRQTYSPLLNDTSQDPSILLQKPKSRRRKTKGPLTKLLHITRVSLEADCARLRSGSYPYRPFEMRKHDVNDPRNRADTIMDVTVLEIPAPFAASKEDFMVVALAFVHEYTENMLKIRTIRNPGRSRRVCHVSPSSTGRSEEGGIVDTSSDVDNKEHLNMGVGMGGRTSLFQKSTKAWLCFRRDTCTELGIIQGTQLRLYNPQCIPMVEPSAVSLFVVCTRLCEIYPSDLPPLIAPS